MKIYTLTQHKIDPNGGDSTISVIDIAWDNQADAEAYKAQHDVYRDTEHEVHELTLSRRETILASSLLRCDCIGPVVRCDDKGCRCTACGGAA